MITLGKVLFWLNVAAALLSCWHREFALAFVGLVAAIWISFAIDLQEARRRMERLKREADEKR